MIKLKSSLFSLCALSVMSTACMKLDGNLPLFSKKSSEKKVSNFVTNNETSVNQLIGDEKIELKVLSQNEFNVQLMAGQILGANSLEAISLLNDLPQSDASAIKTQKGNAHKLNSQSLLLGLPLGLIGEQSIFGGVITKVSDQKSETLGGLKLTDLAPLHVRPLVTMAAGSPVLTLVGCASQCDEDSEQSPLISFPVVGVDKENQLLMVDLSSIGSELNLVAMLDPDGEFTRLKTISSTTTTFDYSVSTLVFDVNTKMIPLSADPNAPDNNVTEFTVRWYLKLNSAFNPAFKVREPTEGVGFFKTERSKTPKITRFSTTNFGQTVKYYIKNVPEKYRPVFARAFDNWNIELSKIIGRNLLSYEFIDVTDARYNLLTPGDIRYNILEWDLENKASYGGLGPSIANQFSGETLAANVLIQGPTIIDLYTKWFRLSSEARDLLAQGKIREANLIVANFNRQATQEIEKRSQAKFTLTLGSALSMNIHSQREELEDPMIKNHFEIVPEGVSFDDYMAGYFTEMLEHELGHNLGLRHNFKGNLGASDSGQKGSVSRSIMEYLGRPYRYLSGIGLYDRMAISYGYRGAQPKHLNWFCTDEDQADDKVTILTKSPECTKSDATSDPFSFWEARLSRAIDMIIDVKSHSAPVWATAEVKSQIDEAITGLTAYAASAEATSSSWTNFFGKADRPEDVAGLKSYVLRAVKKQICDPELALIINAKESAEAQKLAQENLDQLRQEVASKVSDLGVYSTDDLNCL